MTPQALNAEQIQEKLSLFPDWTLEGGALCKVFEFENFIKAFAFMTKAAMVSEILGHHPDWSNVYNRVEVKLSTHDAGGITEKDFDWLKHVSDLA